MTDDRARLLYSTIRPKWSLNRMKRPKWCVFPPRGSVRFASALFFEWIRAAEWERLTFSASERKKILMTGQKKPTHAIMPSVRAFKEKRGKLPKLNRLTVVSLRKNSYYIYFSPRFYFLWEFSISQRRILIFKTVRSK